MTTFLGQTFLKDHHFPNEEMGMLDLIELARTNQHVKLVMTTREYILNQAILRYEKLERHSALDAKYVLQLEDYTKPIRAKILFNHLYFSNLSPEYVQNIVEEKAYLKIIQHENYTPRIIETMTDLHNLKAVESHSYARFFLEQLDHPEQLWDHAFRNINSHSRNLLWTLFSFGGECDLRRLEVAYSQLESLSSSASGSFAGSETFVSGLRELEGSFLNVDRSRVSFHNPSVNDFLQDKLLKDSAVCDALLSAAVFFEQLQAIADVFRSRGPETWDTFATGHGDRLQARMREAQANAALVARRTDGGVAYHWNDAAYVSRAETYVSLFEASKDETYLSDLHLLLEHARQAQHRPAQDTVANWCALLAKIKDFSNSPAPWRTFARGLADEIVKALEQGLSLADFAGIHSLRDRGLFSAPDLRKAGEAFAIYVDQGAAEEEYSALSGSAELQAYQKTFRELARYFDVRVTEAILDIDERIRNYEKIEEEEDGNDVLERWREQQRESLETDRSITIMFNDLLE